MTATADRDKEHQEELDALEKQINELVSKIESLIGGDSPIPIGVLVMPTKPGRARMLDVHKGQYEVNVAPWINQKNLQEGREVKYFVNPQTGVMTIIGVSKFRRNEEKVVVEDILSARTAWVLLQGDTHKLANIGRKIRGRPEKGDEVYYDPVINFITGVVPKKQEKVDVRAIDQKTYQDIGGLEKQIRAVREVVELPLTHPELYERLGTKPPKGIILTGPPGCGKTLIGKAVAHESLSYFIYVRGPEFLSSYVGESAARLRNIFDAARRNAPAIIFFDELESVAGERDETEHTHDRQVVAQLLSLMDGLIPSERVMVIAATNKPELLDEAFRRPGRFDREIVIPVPDRDGRLKILKIYTKYMPLTGVSLESLANETHGFTGADIEGLCKEAALDVLDGIDLGKISNDLIAQIKIGSENFRRILTEMKPSVMRQVTFQKPQETWQDVGGLNDIKQQLEEAIKWPLLYPRLMQIAKQKPSRGILLFGPPGCGKTLIARAFAHECGVNFIPVKGPELLHELVGRSERNVREVFRRAKQAAPCIIFFDEIDALAPNRGSVSHDSGVGNRVTSQLLNELDGIEEAKGIFVLAATNRVDLVDAALLRPGRLVSMYVTLPNDSAREKIFAIHLKGKPLAGDVDLAVLAKRAKLPKGTLVQYMYEGEWVQAKLGNDFPFSGAVIENICREATQKAIREYILNAQCNDFQICARHFEEAFEEVLPAVKSSVKDMEALSQKDDSAPKDKPRTVKVFSNEDLKRVS